MSDEDKRQIFFLLLLFFNFYTQGNAKWRMNALKKYVMVKIKIKKINE